LQVHQSQNPAFKRLTNMRITIAHGKTKQEATEAVDQAIDAAFRDLSLGPLKFTDHQKSWKGSVMSFSLNARLGFLANPIRGTVEVTDRDITIDADLALLNKLIPEERVRTSIETRVRGLLT